MRLIDKEHTFPHPPLVATIGFFDGVHIGHRYLIDQVKELAQSSSLPSAVITFPIHPRKVMQTDYQPALLCGYDEKIAQLNTTGVDYCISLDFTKEMSQLSAREFMQKILKDRINVDTLVIGYDHRFGHNREDGFEEYEQYGKEIGIRVVKAKEYDKEYVSSSLIRTLLKEGDVKRVSHLLSYNYTISGKIIEGFKVGRTIGFPTANIEVWERYKVIPAFGVYAVYAHVEDKRYNAMLYIGNRPTLQNGAQISIEVNLFDFDGNLYNKELTAEFLEFVRGDEKFKSIDILRKQIHEDKLNVINILKNIE